MNVEVGKENCWRGSMDSADVDKSMLYADFWRLTPKDVYEVCFDYNLDHGLMNTTSSVSRFSSAYYHNAIRLRTYTILEVENDRFKHVLEEDVNNEISSLVVKHDPHVEISAFLSNFHNGIEVEVRVSQELSWDPEQNDVTIGEIMNGVDTTMQALEKEKEAMRNIVAEKSAIFTVDNILKALNK